MNLAPAPGGTNIGELLLERTEVRGEMGEQDALFEIEGPDEDGRVWLCSAGGQSNWCRNVGPRDEAVEVLSQWLSSLDEVEVL
jgi:hypothetical protein